MAGKKNSSLDRVLGRLDTLDAVNLANLVQRLARERGVFEEIFNTLQEGILVVSDEGAIEYANASAHRLLGVGDDELTGQIAVAARAGPAQLLRRRARRRPGRGGADCRAGV